MTYGMIRRTMAATLAAAGSLFQVGCSDLTDVAAPDLVQPGSLANPLGAETLRAGAVSAFALAYGGRGLAREGQVLSTGLITDEFTNTSTISGDRDLDAREIPDPGDLRYPYDRLQRARAASLEALDAMQEFVPQAVGKIAQLFGQLGYIALFFAENMCSGVPLSTVEGGRPMYGSPLTTAQLYEQALRQFDSAAVYAADSARILNTVRVARGRLLLNQKGFAEAAAAVSGVPTAYVFATEHAANQANGVFEVVNSARQRGIADREGVNGLNFVSANDPRVRTTLIGKGVDGVTDVLAFQRYSTIGSPIPLATGIEARLIEAEAALDANRNDAATTGSGWLGILNALRATAITPAMAPLADPGSYDARVHLLFRERAFWLFASGHRHGDLRRLVRQYGRSPEQVFPTGSYKGQSLYGSDITFTVSVSEGPNPNWSGQCLSRDP